MEFVADRIEGDAWRLDQIGGPKTLFVNSPDVKRAVFPDGTIFARKEGNFWVFPDAE